MTRSGVILDIIETGLPTMQLQVNEYLRQNLTSIAPYLLTPSELDHVAHDKASFITAKLMRKKFRRRISEETRQKSYEKVKDRLRSSRPIHLVAGFGGYKHFWNPSYPEPDWAELFHLRWMTDFVLPILAVYEPGVTVEYLSEDMILPRMNNYPDEALDAYCVALRKAMDWYSHYTPQNLEIQCTRLSERHDKQAIVNRVEALLPERLAEFKKLTREAQEREIQRSMRAIFWNGKQDLAGLSDEEKYERIIESRIIELAFYDTEDSAEFADMYYWRDERIDICFSWGLSPDNKYGDLTIQTAQGSIVDFWTGRGVLKGERDSYFGTIISQQQYVAAKGRLEVVQIDEPPLPLGNYRTIEVMTSS